MSTFGLPNIFHKPSPLAATRSAEASALDALADGLLLLDEHRVIAVVNPAASQLLAMPAAQLIGREADELATHNSFFKQLLGYFDAPAALNPAAGTLLTLGEVPYQVLVQALTSPGPTPAQPQPRGWVITLRNMLEHKQHDQAKWQFLARVSQELQTPLTAMHLSLSRLQEELAGPLTPEQQNITYTLARENKYLRKLVGELLDVSRLELGTIQLNFKAVHLHTLVQFAADTMRPQLQPKRLVLEVQVPETLPPVRADLEKTTWVLLSLLANAVRYAHLQDHLYVQASRAPDGQHLRVTVRDQGPGIAPADQAKIFQRFSQIPTQGGSGLGLSIAREFMASQGGELGVESAVGAGSTFWFTLPLAGPEAA